MEGIPIVPALALLSTAMCVLKIILFPEVLPGKPITELFALAAGVSFSIWAFYKVFVYPHWFSPFRRLPRPKARFPVINHLSALWERPAGESYRKFMRDVPNGGVICFRTIFNIDRLLLTSPASLGEVLVHKSYDYQKPERVRKFLEIILGEGLVVIEGDGHKFQRKNLMPSFSFRHIKDLYPIFWQKSAELGRCIAAEVYENPEPSSSKESPTAVVEVNGLSSRATLDIIGLAALGRDFHALKNPEDELLKCYEDILEPTPEKGIYFAASVILPRKLIELLPWKLNQTLKRNVGVLRKFCLDTIAEKKRHLKKQGTDDFDILSLLIKSNNFADENLVDQLLTFLAAGHETTSSAFTWLTYLLATHPEIQARLRKEIRDNLPSPYAPLDTNFNLAEALESMPLLNGVCNEVLRLYPTVPVTQRDAVRSSSIGDLRIPKGARLYIVPWAINRSSALWGPDADKFTPERWIDSETGKPNNTGGAKSNYCIMTFLHGPRSCIGERFAKSELRALAAVFCGSFDIKMADPNEVPEPAGAITLKPKNGMRLRLQVVDGW